MVLHVVLHVMLHVMFACGGACDVACDVACYQLWLLWGSGHADLLSRIHGTVLLAAFMCVCVYIYM